MCVFMRLNSAVMLGGGGCLRVKEFRVLFPLPPNVTLKVSVVDLRQRENGENLEDDKEQGLGGRRG